MRGAKRIFEVGAGLPRPKLSWLLGAETAPQLNKKCGGNDAVRRYENRPGSSVSSANPGSISP